MSLVRMGAPSAQQRGEPLDLAVECFIAALLAFAPFAFGSVEPWSEQIVLSLAGLALLCTVVKLTSPKGESPNLLGTSVPVLLFFLIVAMQLVPLPVGMVRAISPNTVRVRAPLTGDAPDLLSGMALSLYPHATRYDLRVVLAAGAVFLSVAKTYTRPEQIRRLLIAITVVGSAVGVLAVLQDLTGASRVFWIGPPGRGKATAGPFIAYTHFGQFMNLSMGAAMGLLLMEQLKVFQEKGFDTACAFTRWRHPKSRWVLSASIVIGLLTVLLSGSRGAILAAAIAFVLPAVTLSRLRGLPGHGWMMQPLLLAVLAVVPFLGFDAIYHRFASLRSGEGISSRVQILEDLPAIYRRYPLLGTGLGTHEVVYPAYDHSTNLARATHVENDYAQAIEETGVVGFAIVIAFLLLMGRCYVRAVHSCDPPIRLTAVGLGFGLTAVLVQSSVDFGQHVPANACLSAACCGLLVSIARLSPSTVAQPPSAVFDRRSKSITQETSAFGGTQPRAAVPQTWKAWTTISVVAGVLVAFGLSLWDADRVRAARAEAGEALALATRLADRQWRGSDAEFAELISHQSAAVEIDPDDVQTRWDLSEYRWLAITRPDEPAGKIVLQPDQQVLAKRIVDELMQARAACPIYGPIYLLAGQIEAEALSDAAAAGHFRQAWALSRNNPDACRMAARVDAAEGRWENLSADLRRLVALVGDYSLVIELCVHQSDRRELAYELARGHRERLTALAVALDATHAPGDLADRARTEALDLWKAECARPDVPAATLAEMARRQLELGDDAAAVFYYRRAIDADYSRSQWHMELARVLAHEGKVPDAMREARICLRLDPRLTDARQLESDLTSER